jgi:hypothetical protein
MAADTKDDGLQTSQLNDASLLGTWCYYCNYSIGKLVDAELTFAADHSFVWRTLEIAKDGNVCLRRTEGTWSLEGDQLKLNIKKQEVPGRSFRERVHFSVRMRLDQGQRELVMQSTRFDDEDHAGEHRLWIIPTQGSPGEADKNISDYQEKRSRKIVLDGPFKSFVTLLAKAIPTAVAQLQIPEPLFCVRLLYYDTHAPQEGYCCWANCLTESMRRRVLHQSDPLSVPYGLWDISNDFYGAGTGIYEASLNTNPELIDLHAQIYELLCESESDNVPKLRTALRQVSLMLHMVKWPDAVHRTDDFVVFPADGSYYFAGEYEEDMRASIPAKRLELLIQRGFLLAE